MKTKAKKKIDIFKKAKGNSKNLKSRFKQVNDNCSNQSRLQDFRGVIDDGWGFSVNMHSKALMGFLESGKLKNIYDIIRDELGDTANVNDFDRRLEERLKGYYALRKEFDAIFDKSERFKYGSLYIAGLGAAKYGPFCIILKKDIIKSRSSVAFIKSDSLNCYVRAGRIDSGLLCKDTADRGHVSLLAAVKHGENLDSDSTRWYYMICNRDDYIEAITTDDISIDHIDKIVIDAQARGSVYLDMVDKHEGDIDDVSKLGEVSETEDFESLMELIESKGIVIEVYSENGY
ncbi:MAG: hypothetical protein HQL06_15345 [Nitrospirae bacterium]|nr:hypothetical protein [Nitrospirota bacterium]